jgi:superfamily II DNA/RNA helicase
MGSENRIKSIHSFQNLSSNLLITTELGSRGINFIKIDYIFVYEMSSNYVDEINKIQQIQKGEIALLVN